MKRVRSELRDVALRRNEPPERGIDVVRPDARRIEEGRALDELDDRAAGGGERATALGVEARLGDAPALDAHAHADEVATGGATGRARVGRVGENAQARGRVEMLGKGAQTWRQR